MAEVPNPLGGLAWLVHGDDSYLELRPRLLELAGAEGLRIEIIASSEIVLEDVDRLRGIAKRSALWIDIELLTPHRRLARQLDPDGPSPEARLRTVEALADAGLCVGVRAIPVLPAINDSLEDLRLLFHRARTYGAAYVRAQPARPLGPLEQARFLAWLGATWPQKVPRYRALFAAGRTGEPGWQRRMRGTLAALRSHTGLGPGPNLGPSANPQGQLALPGLGARDAA